MRALITLLVLGCFGPLVGAAQEGSTSSAAAAWRVLVQQARAAERAGDDERALTLALQASAIDTTPSLWRFIAERQAATGRLADALGSADICQREALRDSAPDSQQHASACNTLRQSLRPRVAIVSLAFTGATPPPGTRATVGGRDVPAGLLDAPFVVDPGTLPVIVSAPEHEEVRTEVQVAAGDQRRVEIRLIRLPDATLSIQSDEPLPPGTTVRVRGEAIDPGALDAPLVLSPGPVSVEVQAPGFALFVRRTTAVRGERAEVRVTLVPLESPRPSSSIPVLIASGDQTRHSAESVRQPALLAVAGLGVGMAISSVGTWLAAERRVDDLEAQCRSTDGCVSEDIESERSPVQRLDRTTNALLFAGAAVAVVGVVLFALVKRERPRLDARRALLDVAF